VRNRLWSMVFAGVVFASVCGLLLTFTRASWLAGGLAAAIIVGLAWHAGRITRAGWLALSGALLAGGIVAAVMAGPILSRLSAKGDDGASSSRVRMALLALDHVVNNPATGVGPGNFINAKIRDNPVQWTRNTWLPRGKSYLPRDLAGLELYEIQLEGRWYYFPGVVHNKFLLVAAELGLVGLGLFLWFLWRLLAQARSALRTRDPLLWWLAVCLIAFLATLVTEGMFDLFYDDKTVATPIFVCALILSLAHLVRAERSAPEALA
jgi:O-antigen ligase